MAGKKNNRFDGGDMNIRNSLTRRDFLLGLGATGALFVVGFDLTGCSPANEGSGNSVAGSGDATQSYDIVIVGAGGAGMSAAISAYDKGVKNICILEKMNIGGGNTNFSSSGMNASETKFEKEQGIEDSNKLFADETFEGGKKTANRELVDFMCNNSAGAIDWLDSLSIRLDNLSQTGGMSVTRCHRPTDGSPVGGVMVQGMLNALEERKIPVITDCKVTSLMKDDSGKVTGVKATLNGKEVAYEGKIVINAAGGLGANQEMVVKYRPDLAGYVTTNQPGATGDGYVLAEAAGAELIQMDKIQIHPTVEQETSTMIAEGIRGTGAILINKEGNRFFDEMSTRDKVSAAELEQPDSFAWLVLDQEVYDANKAFAKYDKAGIVKEAANLSELSKTIQVDADTMTATVKTYNAVAAGETDTFGRTQGLKALVADKTMYAIKVSPGVHHAMGGVRINTKNEALDSSGNVISGLYAAGEVTGGVHGDNRIGGNAVCDIVVFGKNVGESAAAALS